MDGIPASPADPQLRLSHPPEALDGYPVAELAELCEVAESRTHALALAKRLITSWVAQLTHDIESLAAPAPDVLARDRRRMIETRDSLLWAESMFSTLETTSASEPG